MKIILIQTTVSSKNFAQNISEKLIRNKFAACVQVSKINSFYMWDGVLKNSDEFLLSIKTRSDLFCKVKSEIESVHEYDTPEIISFECNDSSQKYMQWVFDSTTKTS